jgi:hypothetical protein
LLILYASAASAQEAPAAFVNLEGVETGWHIVRPGETLIGITDTYLGSPERWRETWKLNPEIQDPNVIQPGTRIRVILSFDKAPPIARLKAVSGRVEERPVPIPWNEARVEDLLVEKDGLRTYNDSSSELEFRDGTNLVLSEESLVFVRPSRRTFTGPTKRSVEIVEGQAEVQALTPGTARTDVEILVGTAKATASPSPEGLAQTRARKAEAGGAQVMVYEGESEVEAAGQSVAVQSGMGTAIAKGAPPAPPEELLPASQIEGPPTGSEWRYGDPWFAWAPVEGAVSYTVEICLDPPCGQLVRRTTGIEESRWRPEPLPASDYYWRVTAVSPSGLDGFSSDPASFAILYTGPDTEPPTGRVFVTGSYATNGGVDYYDRHAQVEVEVTDSQSGVDNWVAQVDGIPRQRDQLAGPWKSGRHTAKATAVDRLGNFGDTETITFEVDADGPAVELRLGGRELLEEKLGAEALPEKWSKRKRRWVKTNSRPTDYRDPVWTVLAWHKDGEALAETWDQKRVLTRRQRPNRKFEIEGNRPGMLLLVAGGLRLGPRRVKLGFGHDVTLFNPDPAGGPGTERNSIVWIGVDDELSGQVTDLSVRTETRPMVEPADPEAELERTYLVIETGDVLGNRRILEWRIRPLEGPG